MNTSKKAAKIVGALFLVAMFSYGAGSGLLESITQTPDFLKNISHYRLQMTLGLLLEFVCGISVVGIAVVMVPVLKQHQQAPTAYWYLGFRIVECTIILFSGIVLLSVITLSQEAGFATPSYLKNLGTTLITIRAWAYQMFMLTYVGGLLFYVALYRAKLVPRFISIWAIAGTILVLTGTLLELFGYKPGIVLAIPGGLNEIFLGIWLLVKGFQTSVFKSASSITYSPHRS